MNFRITLRTLRIVALGTVGAAMLLAGLGGCAGMSGQDKNTAVGAGIGAIGGAILTGGSALGTVGGAAVGGVIGVPTQAVDQRKVHWRISRQGNRANDKSETHHA
jgi:osmotically inducible lipoprotein OsmB